MPLALDSALDALTAQLKIRPLPEPLLREALTHASLLNETETPGRSNERLEFLGDAVLGLIVADELFRLFPDIGEGELTRIRAELVQRRALARVAERIGLGEHLVMGRGEEAAGGRRRERNLAGALEALIGAVYVGHGYRAARALVRRLLGPEFRRVKTAGVEMDPKSRLQHLVQAAWHQPPEYVTLGREMTPDGQLFVVEVRIAGQPYGRGTGPSKREAQRAAARDALRILEASGG